MSAHVYEDWGLPWMSVTQNLCTLVLLWFGLSFGLVWFVFCFFFVFCFSLADLKTSKLAKLAAGGSHRSTSVCLSSTRMTCSAFFHSQLSSVNSGCQIQVPMLAEQAFY